MVSRRMLIHRCTKLGLGLPLWLRLSGLQALAQTGSGNDYKALVCITLQGGNDGNNMLIPLEGSFYQQYAQLRGVMALPLGSLNPLNSSAYSYPLAFHPSMPNLSALFNAGRASVVANIGPLGAPVTKSQIEASPDLLPSALMSHPAGIAQWESATTSALPTSGWGGRIADTMQGMSGSLPMILNAGPASIFTVGNTVQGITVQGGAGATPIPVDLRNVAQSIAAQDLQSSNHLVAQAAEVRFDALKQQVILSQAMSAGNPLKTQFSGSAFGTALRSIAQIINGRSVVGASRQIFYCQQGAYDTHQQQLTTQATYLSDLDSGISSFMLALQEMGLQDNVLICTHSDFNRTMQSNTSGGTDHAWGNHQLILGGGIRGGRIIGTLPDFDLGGANDLNGAGTWIPTLSVTQLAAAAGSWIGLSTAQLALIFPDLAKFPAGAISLM